MSEVGWFQKYVLTPDPCMNLKDRLPSIPPILRKQGWVVGAALMEKWFREARNGDAEKGNHDVNTVKMKWVLSFPRAKAVYDKAIQERVWVKNAKAQEEIVKLIKNSKCLPPAVVGNRLDFGNAGEGTKFITGDAMGKFNKTQIQFRKVSQNPLGTLDDMFAALANFNFNFVVEGSVECISATPAKYKVTIDKVGIYVRDSYDFNDKKGDWFSQPLGLLSCVNDELNRDLDLSRHYITNESFRAWRDYHGNGRGGDYLVFSDIVVLNTQDSFEFSP
jgi:hypothetical protein